MATRTEPYTNPHIEALLTRLVDPLTQTQGGIDYLPHEKGKYNPQGMREPKSPPPEGGKIADALGGRTHPLFAGFEGSCAQDPKALYGGANA